MLSRNHYKVYATYYKLSSDTITFSRWHLASSPGVTTKSAYRLSCQVRPPSSHSTPLSRIHTRATGRCLQLLTLSRFPVPNLELSTPASLGLQRREGHQEGDTQHLMNHSCDMTHIFSRTEMLHFSCVTFCTLYTRRTDQPTDRWYAVLCPSILLFSRFCLLLYTICQAWHT